MLKAIGPFILKACQAHFSHGLHNHFISCYLQEFLLAYFPTQTDKLK